jgi:hypothetical protein
MAVTRLAVAASRDGCRGWPGRLQELPGVRDLEVRARSPPPSLGRLSSGDHCGSAWPPSRFVRRLPRRSKRVHLREVDLASQASRSREITFLARRLHAAGGCRAGHAVPGHLECQADQVVPAPADRVTVHPVVRAAVIGAHPDDRSVPVHLGEQGSRSKHHPLTWLRQPQFGGIIAPVVGVDVRNDVGDEGACSSHRRVVECDHPVVGAARGGLACRRGGVGCCAPDEGGISKGHALAAAVPQGGGGNSESFGPCRLELTAVRGNKCRHSGRVPACPAGPARAGAGQVLVAWR